MPTIRTFHVRPSLPDRLKPLDRIARNLWWCWNHAAVDLFHRIDPDLWHEVGHNPLALLARAGQERLEAAASDDGYVSQLDGVVRALDDYLGSTTTWFRRHGGAEAGGAGTMPVEQFPLRRIGYFSAEFGLTESVPIYSGGLGVLAGDHLKSASDLGLPLVGVSLLYREAFHQYLNADGWQQEIHPETDLTLMPIALVKNAQGAPLVIECELPGRMLRARIWRLDVGRVPLLLLDANIPENAPEDRRITDRLYGGDLEMRIKQEILLGIGGLRALHAAGLAPVVCHMNEGHSAFLALERTRRAMLEHGLSFAEAKEVASSGNCFTTHTPVPAGNDRFPPEMVDRYFAEWPGALGISREQFLALGREEPSDPLEHFCMTVLALKLATRANGVSKLHGRVSRGMWKRVYPGVPEQEIPIGSITNGIHHRSVMGPDMRRLLDSYLGPKWITEPDDPATWERIERIPAEEFWRAHERARERLIAFSRERLAEQIRRRGGSPGDVADAAEVLDPKALTIGFARRFATYKRATLVMRDPARLARILNDPRRPVQLVFAGKAHQKDEPGKEIIRKLVHLAGLPEFRHRIVFLEDYEMNVARALVQGVDVWLNNPLRPLEASGTSGMKAAVNGVLQVSVLDGWWAEAYDPSIGWAIGAGEEYEDNQRAEKIEAEALYHLLETDVVPRFYTRTKDDVPREWIERMKGSVRKLAPVYNTQRMVREYYEQMYRPEAERHQRLSTEKAGSARALASWKNRVASQWDRVGVRAVDAGPDEVTVGATLPVRAHVALGELKPEDVAVEIFQGQVDSRGELLDGTAVPMTAAGRNDDGSIRFEGRVPTARTGRFGFAVRVVPRHAELTQPYGFVPVKWG